jgi:putative ABC transport system ATP-binding protein
MQPFDLLLLDEPFSHLDKANAQKAMQLILEEVTKRKAAVIFADLEPTDFFPHTKLMYL